MNKDQIIEHLTRLVIDDEELNGYLDETIRAEFASKDVQVPADTSDFSPYWARGSALTLELMIRVLNNLLPGS